MLKSLEYRPDFVEMQERMAAFWAGEELDRPCVWITAPRDEPLPGPPAPELARDPVREWLDQDYRLALGDARLRAAWFGGEALPVMQTQLGPGSVAIHLGSAPSFMPGTVWYNECIDDLTTGPELKYRADEEYWAWTLEFIRKASEHGDGKYLVAFPDLIENLDILASLRGSLELLIELVEAPAAVHRYQAQILELYMRYYDEIASLVNIPAYGSVFVSFPVWGPGRVCKLQCDMSAMISPGMFREFVLPYLRSQCQRVDHAFYHLDGPDAICHLPALLEIEELHGIQWTPGAGTEPVHDERWWPLFRQTADAGKKLFLLGAPMESVPALVKEFGRELVYTSTGAASPKEAEDFLARL